MLHAVAALASGRDPAALAELGAGSWARSVASRVAGDRRNAGACACRRSGARRCTRSARGASFRIATRWQSRCLLRSLVRRTRPMRRRHCMPRVKRSRGRRSSVRSRPASSTCFAKSRLLSTPPATWRRRHVLRRVMPMRASRSPRSGAPLRWPLRTAGSQLRVAVLMPGDASVGRALDLLRETAQRVRRHRMDAACQRRAGGCDACSQRRPGHRTVARRDAGRRRGRRRSGRPDRHGGPCIGDGAAARDAPGRVDDRREGRGTDACRAADRQRCSGANAMHSPRCSNTSELARWRGRSARPPPRRSTGVSPVRSRRTNPAMRPARERPTSRCLPRSPITRRRCTCSRPCIASNANSTRPARCSRAHSSRRRSSRTPVLRPRASHATAATSSTASRWSTPASSQNPHSEPLWRVRGELELARHDGVAAEAAFANALALKPTDAEAHYNFGVALQKQGRRNEAARAYQRALAFDPGFPDAHFNLAVVFQETGHPAAAISAYRAVLERDPRRVGAYRNLGEVLLAAGRIDEWLANFRRFEAQCPEALPLAVQALEACQYAVGRCGARAVSRRVAPRALSRQRRRRADRFARAASLPAAVLRRRAGDAVPLRADLHVDRAASVRAGTASRAIAQAGKDPRRLPVRRPEESRDGQDDVAGASPSRSRALRGPSVFDVGGAR